MSTLNTKIKQIQGGFSSDRGNSFQRYSFLLKAVQCSLPNKEWSLTPHLIEDFDLFSDGMFNLFQIKTIKDEHFTFSDINGFIKGISGPQFEFINSNLCVNKSRLVVNKRFVNGEKRSYDLLDSYDRAELISELPTSSNEYYKNFDICFLSQDTLTDKIHNLYIDFIKSKVKIGGWWKNFDDLAEIMSDRAIKYYESIISYAEVIPKKEITNRAEMIEYKKGISFDEKTLSNIFSSKTKKMSGKERRVFDKFFRNDPYNAIIFTKTRKINSSRLEAEEIATLKGIKW